MSYVYTHIHVYIYMYMYLYIYTYLHMYMYICIYIYMYMCTWLYKHIWCILMIWGDICCALFLSIWTNNWCVYACIILRHGQGFFGDPAATETMLVVAAGMADRILTREIEATYNTRTTDVPLDELLQPIPLRLLTGCIWMTLRIADLQRFLSFIPTWNAIVHAGHAQWG